MNQNNHANTSKILIPNRVNVDYVRRDIIIRNTYNCFISKEL